MRRRAAKSGALGLHPHLLVGRDDERGAPLLGHVIVQREYLPQEDSSDALDWGVSERWGVGGEVSGRGCGWGWGVGWDGLWWGWSVVVGEGRTSLADPHAVSQDAALALALGVLLWRVARRPLGIDASDEAEGRRLVRQRDESFLPAVRDEHLKAQG